MVAVLFLAVCGYGAGTALAAEAGNAELLENSGLFLPYVTLPTGSCAEAVAIGDVNNDGMNDVVVATTFNDDLENDHHIHVFTQQPTGELAFSAKYPVAPAYVYNHPTSLDIGDLNNDGKADVVVSASNSIGVFLQNDAGTLDPIVTYASNHTSGNNSLRVRIGDFNNDGLLDVASIDWGASSHDVDVFLQNESGTLDSPAVYVVAHGGYDDLEVGDVNNDGLQDIIVMSGQGLDDTLGILLQNAGGTFDAPVYYDLTENQNTHGVAVGDINGDALQDVTVTYNYNIGVFYQNVSGTLDPSVSYASSGDTKPVDIGDVDSDGRNDVVSAGGSTLEVHLQGTDGSLLPYEIYTIPYQAHYKPHALEIGDVNSDGANDVVLANCGYGLVVVYNSSPAGPVPDIKANGSDGPVYVTPNDTVTISVSLDPGSSAGVRFDWWIGALTPYGKYWLTPSMNWVRSSVPISVGKYPLLELSSAEILDRTLPVGGYVFFFVLDSNPNGILDDTAIKDTVDVFSQR